MSGADRGSRGSLLGISIGIAATRVGMHPQTLREYERQGLLSPARTEGGTRRYREAELDRLRRIQELTADGLSLAGVRHVLELEARLHDAERRVAELEQRLAREEGPSRPPGTAVVRRMSVELVHVPRQRRSPRWRNDA